ELLADLLRSTIIAARDELWEACATRHLVDQSQTIAEWTAEPPPWPPASVAKMLGRKGDRAGSLLESLASQLATDPELRAWLLRSWLAQPRVIDEEVLADLSGAVGGRLFREPRIRDWLRAEWTEWARQRYRCEQ